MVLENARIILKDEVIPGSVEIEGHLIRRISTEPIPGAPRLDLKWKYLAPGIVELHSHGGGGYDFLDNDDEAIAKASECHLMHGVTSILPTAVSASDEALFSFIERFNGIDRNVHRNIIGIHLEGPFFSQEEKGAQEERFIRPVDIEYCKKVLDMAKGNIKRWSFAPELEGSDVMMDILRKEGIMLSAAHTSATYDDISRAFDHGLRMLTHFYSGMSTIKRVNGRRILGTVESGYLIDELYTEIIPDGYHLPPDLLRLIFRLKRNDRITGCSDSMRAAGMGEGPSILGPRDNGLDVIVEDGVAKLPDRSAYAGSVAIGDSMARTLRRALSLPLPDIFRILSLQPAEALGIAGSKGSIEEGKDADLIVLSDDLETEIVFLGGERRK